MNLGCLFPHKHCLIAERALGCLSPISKAPSHTGVPESHPLIEGFPLVQLPRWGNMSRNSAAGNISGLRQELP